MIFLPIDRFLTDTISLGQNGFGSNDNEGVLHIPQSSRVKLHPLVVYGHTQHALWARALTSADIQSVFSMTQKTELHSF